MKTFWELYLSFFKIGVLMFGSGYTMLPLLTHEIVEHRGWATEDELLDAYALSQCVPGVIAVNTAAFIGQKRGGWGGAAAGVLGIITAPIIAILLVATVLMQFWNSPVMIDVFNGVRVAVAAVITSAVISLIRARAASPSFWVVAAILTRPESSISILVLVSLWIARMTLPPGPMISRILSGLILMVSIFGA